MFNLSFICITPCIWEQSHAVLQLSRLCSHTGRRISPAQTNCQLLQQVAAGVAAIPHTSNTRHDRYLQIIIIYHYYYHTSNKCDRCRRPDDECFIWDLNLDNPGSNNVHPPPCHLIGPRTGVPSPCLCPDTGS